jgi:tRNA-2-methylthio-N6-dimethylallyladenosine synthase
LVVGPNDIEHIPSLLKRVRDGKQVAIDGERRRGTPFCIRREGKFKAWVPIIFGCNKFCSFCIVPYVRGRQRSRRSDEVIEEVRGLVERGVVEVTLLGQNVAAYGKDIKGELNFANLLRKINELPGLKRVRFITSHPQDTTKELISAVKESQKVCEHFHLPLQAASNKILHLMNRGYTKEFYRDLISRIREEMPACTITTDLLVGFPGEEGEDFNETMNFVEEIEFDAAFTFGFSPRDGTKAVHLPNRVPDSIKQKRLEELISLQTKITRRKNEELVGTILEVLIEGENPKNTNELIGRTRGDKVVIIPKKVGLEAGRCVEVEITEASTYSMKGKIVWEDEK